MKIVLVCTICLILLSGCSKEANINKDVVWGDFPKSMDSLYDFYSNNRTLFLEEFIEKGDVTTQFICAQFFDNVQTAAIADKGDNNYLVTDKSGIVLLLYMSVEDGIITDFIVKEEE